MFSDFCAWRLKEDLAKQINEAVSPSIETDHLTNDSFYKANRFVTCHAVSL